MSASQTRENLRKILGSNVRKFRQRKNLTQSELAELTDVSTSTVTDIERGITWISDETLARLCNALEIDAPQLFFDSFAGEMESAVQIQEAIFSMVCENYANALARMEVPDPDGRFWKELRSRYQLPFRKRES